jgi:hypothetical protein
MNEDFDEVLGFGLVNEQELIPSNPIIYSPPNTVT